MDPLATWCAELRERPRRWLVTGAAGFIGSHLVERLLGLGQGVHGMDDLSTGHMANLEDVRSRVGEAAWRGFTFDEADVCERAAVEKAVEDADFVLHQAALGSVPRSVAEPLATHAANVEGFLSVLDAARRCGVARFVFASSSSVYGDSPLLPRREGELGTPMSPYAATKRIDELYASAYHRTYGVPTVGLRYFNVFGPRQDPASAYAAVLPRWILALLRGEPAVIHGDGTTTRDFCPVAHVVDANLLATRAGEDALGDAFNVGLGTPVDLRTAFAHVRDALAAEGIACGDVAPRHDDFRPGDVPHSGADLELAGRILGFVPRVDFAEGLFETVAWFRSSPRWGAMPAERS